MAKTIQAGNAFVETSASCSLPDNPDIETEFELLQFGRSTIEIREAVLRNLEGIIGGPIRHLKRHGYRAGAVASFHAVRIDS
jgi:hypothetical protein